MDFFNLVTTETKEVYFDRSPDYRLIKNEANACFFVYRTGKRILTDFLGEIIWQALPGTFDEIVAKVNRQKLVSLQLLKIYLFILVKAGLILPLDEKGAVISLGVGGGVDGGGEGMEEGVVGGDEDGKEDRGEEKGAEGGEHKSKNREEIENGNKEGEAQGKVGEREEKERREEGENERCQGSQTEQSKTYINNLNNNFNEGSFSENKSLDNPLISVIIVSYNGEEYIRRCLRSVFQQTYRPFEVIVVDNASTDATVDIIRRDFPQCQLIELKRNRHYAGGLNRGIKVAQGQYFLLLNQDVFLEPDCVAALYTRLKSEPQAGVAAPLIKFASLPGFINGLGNQINNRGWGTDNFIYCVDVGQFQELKELPSACFGAVFLSREAIERVGYLDEGYGSFYEDVDWSFRCWLRGMRVVPAPEAVVYHEFGGSYPQGKKLFFVVRNRLRLVLKLFQGRIKLGFLKNYVIEDARNCWSLLRKRKFQSLFYYLLAYFSLCLQLPSILVKRRLVMMKKVKRIREKDILMKNPSFYCCLNSALAMPEVDVSVIRRYYLWHFMKGKVKWE